MKKIYYPLIGLLLFVSGLYSQNYSETFPIPNKGILSGPCSGTDGTSCFSQDFTDVNWTIEGNLSGIDDEPFATNASNQLVVSDIDEEACWVSPMLNIVSTSASFSVTLSWLGYDALADYIDVEYTIDGGSTWVTLLNLIGGGPNHTVEYAAGTGNDGSTTITISNISGSTLQIRVCIDHNSAQETTTISNVFAFGAELPAADPCAEAGGDTDADGVCDADDICPDGDDNLDQDKDRIPDACDENPTVADGVLVQAPCLEENQPLILQPTAVDATGRNVYTSADYPIEVRYNAELGRWEVIAAAPGTEVYFYNELASFPGPPVSNLLPWTATSTLCSGSTVSVSGTGTQSASGCNMFIPLVNLITTSPTCPGGTDGTFSVTALEAKGPIFYSLDGMVSADGNFTGLATGNYTLIVRDDAFPESVNSICQISTQIFIPDGVDNELPTITCPEAITVSTDAGTCTAAVTYTAPTGMDNCSIESTTLKAGLGTGAAFPLGTTTETYEVTDAGGNVAECSFTVTVEDMEAPTATCQPTATLDLDTTGMGVLTVAAINMGSFDACGDLATLSLDRDTFSCDDLGEVAVMLTVTDAVGLSATCSTLVTVVDAQAFCASTPVRDLYPSVERLPLAPNPASAGVNVDLSGFEFSAGQRMTLSLFNSLGQRLHTLRVAADGQQSFYLPTAEYPAGVYFLRLDENNRPRATARLVLK